MLYKDDKTAHKSHAFQISDRGKISELDLERGEFGENLALLGEELKFRSVPDPARSELNC